VFFALAFPGSKLIGADTTRTAIGKHDSSSAPEVQGGGGHKKGLIGQKTSILHIGDNRAGRQIIKTIYLGGSNGAVGFTEANYDF
jgi:hypothetical protein